MTTPKPFITINQRLLSCSLPQNMQQQIIHAINIILYPYLLLKTGWHNCRIVFLDSALD